MSAKTFDHLKTLALIDTNPIEATTEVFEAKLHCGPFARDESTWIEYHCYLKGNEKHLEAKRVLERALEKVSDK